MSDFKNEALANKEIAEKQAITSVVYGNGQISRALSVVSPVLEGSIGFDEFDGRIYVCGKLPWDFQGVKRPWSSTDDAYFRQYIEDELTSVSFRKDAVEQVLLILADKNKYDSLIARLETTYENWDGQKRVGHLFHWFLGAEDTAYNREVEHLLFSGAVMRAYEPGVKFDYLPVLIGTQGIGKSTFCRYMALEDRFFSDAPLDVKSKEGRIALQGKTVVEVSELASFNPNQNEYVKSFISSTQDDYREPYAKQSTPHLRRCVMVGTTNEDMFLNDKTGNRRYLPVECGIVNPLLNLFDEEEARKVFEQAWGETIAEYKDKGLLPLVLTKEGKEHAEEAQERAQIEDPRIEAIGNFLETCKGERVNAKMIAEKALAMDSPDQWAIKPIHDILKRHFPEWKRHEKKERVGSYGASIVYEYKPD